MNSQFFHLSQHERISEITRLLDATLRMEQLLDEILKSSLGTVSQDQLTEWRKQFREIKGEPDPTQQHRV